MPSLTAPPLIEREIEQRDADGAGEEDDEDAEEEPAEDEVLALLLRCQIHQSTTGLTAAATKRRAR
jgi:hypothetical protein